jgi:hypothetical protein
LFAYISKASLKKGDSRLKEITEKPLTFDFKQTSPADDLNDSTDYFTTTDYTDEHRFLEIEIQFEQFV